MKKQVIKKVKYVRVGLPEEEQFKHEITLVEEDGTKRKAYLWRQEEVLLQKFGQELPTRDYTVKYEVDLAGKLVVYCPIKTGIPDIHPFEVERHNGEGSHYVNVCFLPPDWHGLRVTRTIETGLRPMTKKKKG